MTDQNNHPEHAQENGQPMNIAALLRASADGELTDCQCEELDAYMAQNPEAESQIAFEQAMKDCCSRAMAKPCCPDVLRAKIVAMAGAPAPAVAEAIADSDTDAYAARIEASNAQTRSSSFWSRSPVMGAAAALLMVVAGTLIWQSASLGPSSAPEHFTSTQATYFDRVSNFVVKEHNRCCDDKAAQNKLVNHDINQAVAYFSEEFEHELVLPDMVNAEGQVQFFGGGDCSVPSTSRSGHLRFDAINPDGTHISLSLFISPDPGLLPMQEGITYPLNAKACTESGARIFAWVNNGVQYLLVSEAEDNMCATVREIMHAPTTIGSI
tara:strand:+ start:29859 stop:30833 length:975 start_codon:yes stop_codon:yes gene_type:complete